MLTQNRKLYERASAWLGKVGAVIGLSPDFWTLAGVATSVVTAYLLVQRAFGWALVSLLVLWLTDMLDGATARATNKISAFGGVLDHVSDRYAELIICAGVLLSGLVAPIWVLFGYSGALMASYVRSKAESMTNIGSVNVGLAGRTEKAVFLVVGICLEMFGMGVNPLQWAFIVVGLFSHYTAFQRMLYTRRQTRAQQTQSIPVDEA